MQTENQTQSSVTTNPTIRNRYTNAVIYEGTAGMTTREMLEKATSSSADLSGANLYGVDLSGADLRDANLYGADLSSANLSDANLSGANLRSADLRDASLGDTYGKLQGERPFFQCGPIGSRSDYLQAFITDKGTVIKAGCFTGFIDEFVEAVEETHGDSRYAKEYQMAVRMVESHVALWGEGVEE